MGSEMCIRDRLSFVSLVLLGSGILHLLVSEERRPRFARPGGVSALGRTGKHEGALIRVSKRCKIPALLDSCLNQVGGKWINLHFPLTRLGRIA